MFIINIFKFATNSLAMFLCFKKFDSGRILDSKNAIQMKQYIYCNNKDIINLNYNYNFNYYSSSLNVSNINVIIMCSFCKLVNIYHLLGRHVKSIFFIPYKIFRDFRYHKYSHIYIYICKNLCILVFLDLKSLNFSRRDRDRFKNLNSW